MNQKKTKKRAKKSILLLVLATLVLPVLGGHVSENTARQVANQTLSRSSATHSVDATQSSVQTVPQKTAQLLFKSSSSNNEIVYFYVFGGENNEGFVIVSGDDRVLPVLGYSDTNSFPTDNIPENVTWWLGEYAKQIQFAIDNNIEPSPEIYQQWAQYLGTNDNKKEE